MNKIEQINTQIAYHKDQLERLRLVKAALRERIVKREYEQFYWSVVGKYYRIEDDVYKVIYTNNSNSYLSTRIVSREDYKYVECLYYNEYYNEYYKGSCSVRLLKTATEITEQEFWKYNKKYENNKI